MDVEDRLVPTLREGVNIVRMILFKELKSHLTARFPDEDNAYILRLAGAIANEIFGTPNTREPFAGFCAENRARIDEGIAEMAAALKELRIPLTDAIRVQFLCDSREGINTEHILRRAQSTGILVTDREVPLPRTFMNLVRKLGVSHGLLKPEALSANELP